MRRLLLCVSLLALVAVVLVSASSSSAVHARYELKSVHTLSRASAGRMQTMQLARIRISGARPDSARVSMHCGSASFEASSDTGRFLVTAGAASGHPLHAPRAEHSIYSRVQAMTWFEGEDTQTHKQSMDVFVLLHKLPTAEDVAATVAASDDDSTTTASLATTASIRSGFGGWPQVIRPCSDGADDSISSIQSLDCCTVVVTSGTGVEHSASLQPAQPRNMQHTHEQAYPAVAAQSQSEQVPAVRTNASETLLQWKRVLFAVESTTPLFASAAVPAHLPSHMPPTRAQRREFLSQALRRRELHIRNHQPSSSAASRMSASELASHSDAASVTAFVEQSGWSSTSLADVMAPGVDSGLSPATAEIVAPTAADLEEVGELMQEVTTTFLQASEQVHAHLRAGVSARQVIATICNKLVLKSMPPKVGLAITKSLQQAVLNVMKSSTADQLTQYLVPPSGGGEGGGGEAFVEHSARFKPTSQASMVQDLVAQVAAINPEVARAIAEEEAARQRDVLDQMAQREADRQRRMKLTSLGNVFVELESQIEPAASASAGAGAAAKEDKYASFLSTYSAARIRALSKVKGSGSSITEQITSHLTPQLTNGIAADSSAQLSSSLHTLLHESLSDRLHAGLSKTLTDSLTTSLTASISESQVSLLSVMLRDQLTRDSTAVLTKSLNLLLTPALSLVLTRSLTRSPQSDYYCHLCSNPQANFPDKPAEFHMSPPPGANPSTPYCISCAESKAHEYYLDYYSAYYARYYSDYFSYYYGNAFAKAASDNLLGICLETPAPPQPPVVEPEPPGCLGTGEVASVAGCVPLPPEPEPEPAPEPAPEPSQPPSLKGVNFDNDKSTLRPESFAILDHAIEVLKQRKTGSVLVEGHTDSNASNAYNQALSERRANTVKQYLQKGGVTVPLNAQGFGEERPIDTNDTPEGRFNNRRVELSFHD